MASIFDCPGSWDCNTSPIKVSDSLFLVALLSGELHLTQPNGEDRGEPSSNLSLSKFCGVLFPFSAANGQQLTSSESVVKGQGEKVTLSCRVTGFALTNLYWICQKPGHGLELIEWS
ncbi:unnamed protein product [Boreogadus saida]